MLISHKYEGKNEEELLKKAALELNSKVEDIYYNSYNVEGGLFKSKKIVIELVVKEELLKNIKEYFNELGKLMNLNINSEINIDNKNINITLVCDNNNLLIGKDGKTLNSLQLLVRQTFSEISKFGIKVLLDIGNYKIKKLKYLEYEVQKICKDVINSKIEVKLDAMNSYERRTVHSIVSTHPNLISVSYGEGSNRYTVIKYKDN